MGKYQGTREGKKKVEEGQGQGEKRVKRGRWKGERGKGRRDKNWRRILAPKKIGITYGR